MAVAERITQLGGEPNFNPEGLADRSASQYSTGPSLIDMIRENLIAERIAVDHYRELIRFLARMFRARNVCWNGFCRRGGARGRHARIPQSGGPMLRK